MSDKLKAGDVVCLKSGGPRMTINKFRNNNDNEADCSWFMKSVEKMWLHINSAYFHIDSLVKCDDDSTIKETK